MFETVLFPLNFSEPSLRIRQAMTYLSNLETKNVELVHVLSSGMESTTKARKRLEKRARLVEEAGFNPETLIRTGHDASEIVWAGQERGVDFICLPWKKKSWLQKALLGSTTKDVTRLTNIPILVYKYRPGIAAEDDERLTALYATDTHASDEQVIPYLKAIGPKAKCLYLLNVGERAPDPNAEAQRLIEMQNRLDSIRSECIDEYDSIETVTVIGTPKREIVRRARRLNVDLIALRRSTVKGSFGSVMGSTAEHVANNSRCSVLVIPTQEG